MAVENMPQSRSAGMFNVRRKSCYLPEHLASVGQVTLDTSHAGASRVDILRAHSVLAAQLRHIHLSDSNLEVGRDEHRLPGKGRLPEAFPGCARGERLSRSRKPGAQALAARDSRSRAYSGENARCAEVHA